MLLRRLLHKRFPSTTDDRRGCFEHEQRRPTLSLILLEQHKEIVFNPHHHPPILVHVLCSYRRYANPKSRLITITRPRRTAQSNRVQQFPIYADVHHG